MKFTFHIDAPIIRHKGGFIMSTIFPREEKTEQIFDEILKNPHACERLKDTFFEAIPSAEESEGAGTDIPGTVFAAALFHAYENKDLSAMVKVSPSTENTHAKGRGRSSIGKGLPLTSRPCIRRLRL